MFVKVWIIIGLFIRSDKEKCAALDKSCCVYPHSTPIIIGGRYKIFDDLSWTSWDIVHMQSWKFTFLQHNKYSLSFNFKQIFSQHGNIQLYYLLIYNLFKWIHNIKFQLPGTHARTGPAPKRSSAAWITWLAPPTAGTVSASSCPSFLSVPKFLFANIQKCDLHL